MSDKVRTFILSLYLQSLLRNGVVSKVNILGLKHAIKDANDLETLKKLFE